MKCLNSVVDDAFDEKVLVVRILLQFEVSQIDCIESFVHIRLN